MNECLSIISNSVTCHNGENVCSEESVNTKLGDGLSGGRGSDDGLLGIGVSSDKELIKAMSSLNNAMNHISAGHVPVSAMLVNKNDGNIVATAQNESKHSLLHAEMIVLNSLPQKKHLQNYDLFVTLEPCPMCKHAIRLMKVNRVIFGAYRNFFADGFWSDSCKLAHKKLMVYDLYRKNSLRNSLKYSLRKIDAVGVLGVNTDSCERTDVPGAGVVDHGMIIGSRDERVAEEIKSYSSISKSIGRDFFHPDALFSPSFRQEYIGGICENECSNLVKKFFKRLRGVKER